MARRWTALFGHDQEALCAALEDHLLARLFPESQNPPG
jgi:hypothetical protein